MQSKQKVRYLLLNARAHTHTRTHLRAHTHTHTHTCARTLTLSPAHKHVRVHPHIYIERERESICMTRKSRFNCNVIKICQTAYFELKRISSIRRFLAEDATKTLVTSCILSRLDYCNCLLMGTPNSLIQRLQKIQNFAAKLVLLARRHQHSTPLLEKLHWLPISERIKYKVACMCFSAINGSGPAYLSELLHVYIPSRTLRSYSDTRMLEIQKYKRKTHGFRAFSCFGPHIWNSLPQDLRHCSTLSSFKTKLKTFLFSQYFHPN